MGALNGQTFQPPCRWAAVAVGWTDLGWLIARTQALSPEMAAGTSRAHTRAAGTVAGASDGAMRSAVLFKGYVLPLAKLRTTILAPR